MIEEITNEEARERLLKLVGDMGYDTNEDGFNPCIVVLDEYNHIICRVL